MCIKRTTEIPSEYKICKLVVPAGVDQSEYLEDRHLGRDSSNRLGYHRRVVGDSGRNRLALNIE